MSTSSPDSRTSLCLWLPTFELRLELVRTPELDATSVALLTPDGGEIWQISDRAADGGVRPGMRVSRALSHCPSLTLLEPDPTHYGAATREILDVLEGMSPIVQPNGQGIFHIGVDGLERLHGSPRSQVDRTLYTLLEILPRALVAAIRVGRAPGCFGAWVAATAARPGHPVLIEEGALASFLASQPTSVLPIPVEMLERLERLDILTLGELGQLPLVALTRHFGRQGREARALARGERIDPVRPLHRPQPIRTFMDLPAPIRDRASLHAALERLVERGLARPERKDRSILGIRAGGHLEEGGSWEVAITLRKPSSRGKDLVFSIQSRMRLSPPPRALESLFVEFHDFGAPVVQHDLFHQREGGEGRGRNTPRAADRISRTLKEAVRELTLKMGHSPLYRVVEAEPRSRIPERRHALIELDP